MEQLLLLQNGMIQVEVKDTYTTTKDDINKVYTLKAVLNGALDATEVTLGTVTITTKVPTSADILNVTWDCSTDTNGNPTFTYDGTAHYPKLKTISLKDGSIIDAASATTAIHRSMELSLLIKTL